jgi:hypothetical protein
MEPDVHVVAAFTGIPCLFVGKVDLDEIADVAELIVLTWHVVAALTVDVVCSHSIWQKVNMSLET